VPQRYNYTPAQRDKTHDIQSWAIRLTALVALPHDVALPSGTRNEASWRVGCAAFYQSPPPQHRQARLPLPARSGLLRLQADMAPLATLSQQAPAGTSAERGPSPSASLGPRAKARHFRPVLHSRGRDNRRPARKARAGGLSVSFEREDSQLFACFNPGAPRRPRDEGEADVSQWKGPLGALKALTRKLNRQIRPRVFDQRVRALARASP